MRWIVGVGPLGRRRALSRSQGVHDLPATNCRRKLQLSELNNNSNLISEAKRTQFRAIKVLDGI
jgi:hypothetical protein